MLKAFFEHCMGENLVNWMSLSGTFLVWCAKEFFFILSTMVMCNHFCVQTFTV